MEGKAFVSLITDVLEDADIATIKFLVKVILNSVFIPATLKKCGVLCYNLFSKNCIRVYVRPSLRLYVRQSVTASFSLSARNIF